LPPRADPATRVTALLGDRAQHLLHEGARPALLARSPCANARLEQIVLLTHGTPPRRSRHATGMNDSSSARRRLCELRKVMGLRYTTRLIEPPRRHLPGQKPMCRQ